MSAPTQPPSPIWRDDASGLTVWMNGALIEIDTGGDTFARMLPEDAAELPGPFATAIAEALAWSARWNVNTRTYDAVEVAA